MGEEKTALSVSWYSRQKPKDGKHKVVMNNARNYLERKQRSPAADALWSNFSKVTKKSTVKNFTTSFCPCNARATNEYGSRHHLAYLINVYDNPLLIKWFREHGAIVNEEAFALSQLLQWVWRSAIRNGEPVDLYLPSSRMRRLLMNWLGES